MAQIAGLSGVFHFRGSGGCCRPDRRTPLMPSILLLQVLNLCIGGASYLMIASSAGVWSHGTWREAEVGMAMFLANLAYASSVSLFGGIADRWGRTKIAILGAGVVGGAAVIGFVGTPLAAAIATILGFLGCAMFFPGNAGLFSDAKGPVEGASVPLHVKVSRYNLGWSLGNVVGFGGAFLLADQPSWVAFAVALGLSLVPIAVLARWWSLPPRPPAPEGDRAPHPALPLLTRMGRISLLLYALVGMSVISLLETTLARMPGVSEPHRLATATLAAYAVGYVLMFAMLGSWSGWVLRPLRLLALQGFLPLAALILLVLSEPGLGSMVGIGLLLGFAYGAVYTGSIYYSLRLPEGAAQAASLHETFLGVGSTVGPLVAMGALAWWATTGHPSLVGLGLYMALGAVVLFAWQASQIPAILKKMS